MNTTTYRLIGILFVTMLAGLLGCRGTDGDPGPGASAEPSSTASAAEAAATTLYSDNDCGLCHGDDRNGTDMGPKLKDLEPFWTVDRLVIYLEDPLAFQEAEPEFLERRQQFEMEMPPFDHLPEADRRALATWLLAE
jgi:mono/diheme cytochrome c family protein